VGLASRHDVCGGSSLGAVKHLLLIEVIEQAVEPTFTEILRGQFQPPLRHQEKRGACALIGGPVSQIKALSRQSSEAIFTLPQ
jgi:hypothetical protein